MDILKINDEAYINYTNTLNYLSDYLKAETNDYFFITGFNFMTVHNIPHSILTEKQSSFLLSKKLLDIIDENSFSYSYINDIFTAESSNIPLDDSVFLYSIFEFVNLYLYIHNPEYVIPTKNKKSNIDMLPKVGMTFNNAEGSPSQKAVTVGFKYLINYYRGTLKLNIILYDNVFLFVIPINQECNILAHSANYRIENPNDFLFKVISIYEDIVGAILDEELYIQ